MTQVKYHQRILDILGLTPEFIDLVDVIQQKEEELGVSIPESVIEFYSLVGLGAKCLGRYSYGDPGIEVAKFKFLRFKDIYRRTSEKISQSPADHPMMLFQNENQGCAYWTLNPQEMNLPDPPVYMHLEGEANPKWRKIAGSFSKYMLYQVIYFSGFWEGTTFEFTGEPLSRLNYESLPNFKIADKLETYTFIIESRNKFMIKINRYEKDQTCYYVWEISTTNEAILDSLDDLEVKLKESNFIDTIQKWWIANAS